MSANYGTILVVGSGPGIGRNVAKVFASRGFQQVVLLSRNASRLEEDAAFVKSAVAGVDVQSMPVDLSDKSNLNTTLAEVDKHLSKHPLQAVLFNAARVGTSKFFETTADELNTDIQVSLLTLGHVRTRLEPPLLTALQTTVVGLYVVASWAIPQLVKLAETSPSSKPAFLVTSGLLYQEPFPQLFSLSTCKAAQYSLVHSLYKEFGPKGVHCASVVVAGVVSDDSKVTTAANVANEAWALFAQEKGKWTLDVTVRDPDYDEMIRGRERSGETW